MGTLLEADTVSVLNLAMTSQPQYLEAAVTTAMEVAATNTTPSLTKATTSVAVMEVETLEEAVLEATEVATTEATAAITKFNSVRRSSCLYYFSHLQMPN